MIPDRRIKIAEACEVIRHSPPQTHQELREQAERIAREMARAEARRAPTPQLCLEAR